MGERKRLSEIQIARALAITGVLCVHGFSTAVIELDNASILYPLYNFLNNAGRLGTPTFIMLSSFILFYTYFNRTLNKKLVLDFFKKRIKFILIPYLFFSIFYFLFKWYYVPGFQYPSLSAAWDRLQYYILLGKAHPHLYFVFISVQFYIIFPLFLWTMQKSHFLRKYAIIIGFVIQWIWIYINRHYLQVEYKGSVMLTYASFYFLGAYLGIYYEQIKSKMASNQSYRDKTIAFIAFSVGTMVILFTGYYYLLRINVWGAVASKIPNFFNVNAFEILWGLYCFFAAIAVLMTANFIARSKHEKLKRFLTNLGIMSFGIYLIHPFFLLLLRDVFVTGNSLLFHFYQVLTITVVSVISYYLVYFIYRYLPYSWILFGKSEVKYKFDNNKN